MPHTWTNQPIQVPTDQTRKCLNIHSSIRMLALEKDHRYFFPTLKACLHSISSQPELSVILMRLCGQTQLGSKWQNKYFCFLCFWGKENLYILFSNNSFSFTVFNRGHIFCSHNCNCILFMHVALSSCWLKSYSVELSTQRTKPVQEGCAFDWATYVVGWTTMW